jgi:hypothetical protein
MPFTSVYRLNVCNIAAALITLLYSKRQKVWLIHELEPSDA